jgi:hypothetical protein
MPVCIFSRYGGVASLIAGGGCGTPELLEIRPHGQSHAVAARTAMECERAFSLSFTRAFSSVISMTAKTRMPPCSSAASSSLPLHLREHNFFRTSSAASLRVLADGSRCCASYTKLASCRSRFLGADPPHPTAKHSPQESRIPTAWVSLQLSSILHLQFVHSLYDCFNIALFPCPGAADPVRPLAPASSSPELPLTPVSTRRRLILATCATLFSCAP